MRWFLLIVLAATTAFAGDRRQRPYNRFNASVSFNAGWVAPVQPRVVVQPVYLPLAWWAWYPVQQQPVAPPPPPVIIEREIIREVPAPQVIIIEQPAPAPAPVVEAPPVLPPAPPAPVSEAPKPPPGPRVPGPDVFTWLDEDGVTHYSTRVPASAKARAKKIGAPAK